MRKMSETTSQKTGQFRRNPKKLAVSGLQPKTSQARTGRRFTCSARFVVIKCGKWYIKCQITQKPADKRGFYDYKCMDWCDMHPSSGCHSSYILADEVSVSCQKRVPSEEIETQLTKACQQGPWGRLRRRWIWRHQNELLAVRQDGMKRRWPFKIQTSMKAVNTVRWWSVKR